MRGRYVEVPRSRAPALSKRLVTARVQGQVGPCGSTLSIAVSHYTDNLIEGQEFFASRKAICYYVRGHDHLKQENTSPPLLFEGGPLGFLGALRR